MKQARAILVSSLILLTVTSVGCATVRYAVPGQEIADAKPQGPELTLRTAEGERRERMETAALDQWGPEWTLALQPDRQHLVAQARVHASETFILTSAERDTTPVLCGIGGLLIGALVGAALGAHVGSQNQQAPFESLSDGVSGFMLGGLGGYALGAISCVIGKGPTAAHLVPTP